MKVPTPAYRCSLGSTAADPRPDPEQIKERAGATSRSWDLVRRRATRLGRTRTAAPDRRSAVHGRKERQHGWSGRSRPGEPVHRGRTNRPPPPVRVQGYFNCWPAIKRMPWENSAQSRRFTVFPPDPAPSTECWRPVGGCSGWEEQRHLVWMRAQRYPWKSVAASPATDHGLASLAGGTGDRGRASCKRRPDGRSPPALTLRSCDTLQRHSGILRERCGFLTPFRGHPAVFC